MHLCIIHIIYTFIICDYSKVICNNVTKIIRHLGTLNLTEVTTTIISMEHMFTSTIFVPKKFLGII